MIIFGTRVFCPHDSSIPSERPREWKYVVVPREVLRTNSVARAMCEIAFMRFDESPESAIWTRVAGTEWGLDDEKEVTVATFDGGALDEERRVEATFVFGKRDDATTTMKVACLDVKKCDAACF